MVTEIIQPERSVFGSVRKLRSRSPILFDFAMAHLILLAVVSVFALIDDQMVTGVNRWIKPMKFASSVAIYLFTIGWLMPDIGIEERLQKRLGAYLAWTVAIEIGLITMQAARGVGSHFNNTTPFDAMVFAIMGIIIVANIAGVVYLAFHAWRNNPGLPLPYIWGIRIGLLLFVLASLEGFAMVSHAGHSVGVSDGGAGLTFVNWSTKGGDLRIAHFVGIHALQVLPILGYLVTTRTPSLSDGSKTRIVKIAGAIYGLIALALFLQALEGRPLVAV
jgi:hypothetical protein